MAWTTAKFTGSGALAVTLNPELRFILENVRLTLNAKGTTSEDFTCVLDSAAGSEYDVELITQAMSGVKSIVCGFGNENKFELNDKLVFALANSDSLEWGLEIRLMAMC